MQSVAVVGLFRKPGRARGARKQLLKRDELDPDEPQAIKVRDNTLYLRPLK